jgi:hypothetical protein
MFLLPIKEKANFIVIDSNTKEELIGVKVTVDSTTQYTDFMGIVQFDIHETDTVTVEYPSYETTKKVVNGSCVIELKSK